MMNYLVFIAITVTTALSFSSGSDLGCVAHGTATRQCSPNPELASLKQFRARVVTIDRPGSGVCRHATKEDWENGIEIKSRSIVIPSAAGNDRQYECLGFQLGPDYFDLTEVKQALSKIAKNDIVWNVARVDQMNAVDGTWTEKAITPLTGNDLERIQAKGDYAIYDITDLRPWMVDG